MRIEEELRGALDVAAPPPATRLDDVLRRGKRRVAGRRIGLAGGVMVLVAVVGIGSVVWRAEPAEEIQLALNPANWESAPTGGAAWEDVDRARPQLGCVRQDRAGSPTMITDQPSPDLMRTIRGTVQSTLPGRTYDSPLPEQLEGDGIKVFEVDVLDGQGAGGLRFTVSHYQGTPVGMADHTPWAWSVADGHCQVPRRHQMPDGSVYQLNPLSIEVQKDAQLQTLHIFRPGGWALRIDQVSAGRTSAKATRETLPLSEVELVKLGTAVAEVS